MKGKRIKAKGKKRDKSIAGKKNLLPLTFYLTIYTTYGYMLFFRFKSGVVGY
jgi:hypothetical protein